MKIAALRYTYRFNEGNYQHSEISVEAIPEDGQTAESLLAETRAFVHDNHTGSKAAPVQAAKSTTAPPMAKAAPPVEQSQPPAAQADAPKRGKGRPPKALAEAKAAVTRAKEAKTLEAFADEFNNARSKAGAFTTDEWAAVNGELANVYRQLNSVNSDPEVVSQIISAFKAERTAIDTKTHGQAA